MAMSLGKSSSMAAVLLVVALVAGTCASGAQAQFTITFVCKRDAVIRNGAGKAYTLPNGQSVHLNESASHIFIHPFEIIFSGTPSLTIEIPEKHVLQGLRGLTEILKVVQIKCKRDSDCFNLVVTVKGKSGKMYTETLHGRFCPAPVPRQ